MPTVAVRVREWQCVMCSLVEQVDGNGVGGGGGRGTTGAGGAFWRLETKQLWQFLPSPYKATSWSFTALTRLLPE